MDIFFWVVDLLIPLSMIVIGMLFITKPPANRNYFMGYRTFRSMESQEAWDFAHKLCGKVFIPLGLILLVLVVAAKLTIPMEPEYLTLINTGAGIIALVAPIPYVESKLKSRTK